jgi:hypothetical protein
VTAITQVTAASIYLMVITHVTATNNYVTVRPHTWPLSAMWLLGCWAAYASGRSNGENESRGERALRVWGVGVAQVCNDFWTKEQELNGRLREKYNLDLSDFDNLEVTETAAV